MILKKTIMKTIKTLAAMAIMGSSALFTSCGMSPMGAGTQTGNMGNASLLSALGTGMTGNAANGMDLMSLLGNVIGAMTNQSGASIVGTWVYAGPAVEFESSNFLAQAGGAVAGQQVASKISPYFEKIGLKPGAVKMTFNQDNTCSYTANGKTYNGTYTYDATAHTLNIKGATTAIPFPASNVSFNATNMNITFKTSALLNAVQSVGSKSNNSTISTISTLASQFSGMQTGFQFQRQ